MVKHVYDITPVAKPRQTRRDKWKKRPIVLRYRAFCDEIRMNRIQLPEWGYHITFILPMPKSWPESRKKKMNGAPHQQVPDKDNLEKALLDALFENDSHIWDGRVTKRWGREGKIVIEHP